MDPADGPIQAFAARLRKLREEAGRPTFAAMARATGRSRTALSEASGGDQFPRWETVEAYVRACGGDPTFWRLQWERTQHEVTEARAIGTARGGPAPPASPGPDAAPVRASAAERSAAPDVQPEPGSTKEPPSDGPATVPATAQPDRRVAAAGFSRASSPSRWRSLSRWDWRCVRRTRAACRSWTASPAASPW